MSERAIMTTVHEYLKENKYNLKYSKKKLVQIFNTENLVQL